MGLKTRRTTKPNQRASGRECNAVSDPQGPAAARMDFFNGLLGRIICLALFWT